MSIEALNRAVRGYGETASRLAPAATEAAPTLDFASLVKSQVTDTIGAMQGGENATVGAIAGTMDTQSVVEAVAQAELSLQKLTAIRDKVIGAYQEIMRMPI